MQLKSASIIKTVAVQHGNFRDFYSAAFKTLAQHFRAEFYLLFRLYVLHIAAAANSVILTRRIYPMRRRIYYRKNFCIVVIAMSIRYFNFKFFIRKGKGNKNCFSVNLCNTISPECHFFSYNCRCIHIIYANLTDFIFYLQFSHKQNIFMVGWIKSSGGIYAIKEFFFKPWKTERKSQ